MRQPDKHKKTEQETKEAEKNAVVYPIEEENVDVHPEIVLPADEEITDGPDGTFAVDLSVTGRSEPENADINADEVPNNQENEPKHALQEEPTPDIAFEQQDAVGKPDDINEDEDDEDESSPKKKAFIPLWKRNPEKYRKKRPLIVRILCGFLSLIFFFVLTFGAIGVVVCAVAATVVYSFTDASLDEKLANLELDYTSMIYVNSLETGGYVAYEELYNDQNRVWVSYDEMPKCLLEAVIAVEDKRFYEHNGVDIITTAKATASYVFAKLTHKSTSNLAGGSTLTQQLVKNISGDRDQSPTRKIKEMLRALYVERKYSKEQIIEYYLNAVNFGNNQNGIYSAAKYYFDKEVKDLTLTEAASIIGITKSPAYLEPYKNPEENKTRRQTVLYLMYEQGKISEEEFNSCSKENLVLRDRTSSSSSASVMSWYSDMVFEEVKTTLMNKFGYSSTQAVNMIYTDGLRIYTAMVKEYQDICENYFYNEDNYIIVGDDPEEEQPEIAFELLDPYTGNVLAVIGGRGVKDKNRVLNRATQTVRQPGSAIKPITVYGYAIENDIITAATAIDESPLQINATPIRLLAGQNYYISPVDGTEIKFTYAGWPSNYSGEYSGYIDVKNALSNSYNTTSVKVLSMIGVSTSYNFAKTMLGLKNLVAQDKDLAPLSVGALTYGVTLQELTAAYTVFINDGIYSSPRCVTRVETYDGKVLYENEIDKRVVFTPQTAYIMTNILDDLKGSAADAEIEGVATAGKSGTTTSYKDRWFIGYTTNFLAGVWWGYDTPNTNDNAHHIVMWQAVMTQIEEAYRNSGGTSAAEFPVPDGIETEKYCSVSGKLPTDACRHDQRSSRSKTGVYKSGTTPTEYCTMHHYLYVCKETGQIACQNCTDVELKVYIDSNRSYPNAVIKTKDAQYVCPPLSASTILYNDQKWPVYTYMVPEGEYPTLNTESKKRYANCICSAHATEGINHYYTFSLLSETEQATILASEKGMILPDDLPSPDTIIKYYMDTSRYKVPQTD